MSNFKSLSEFDKELNKLKKKFRSLDDDLTTFENILINFPTGLGKNFTILHLSENVKIVKARLACRSLKNNSLRVIYAHHQDTVTFVHIELYFKGKKTTENKNRIKEYLEKLSN